MPFADFMATMTVGLKHRLERVVECVAIQVLEGGAELG
jgi:hypothetical protein